jgi:hypothetical protein
MARNHTDVQLLVKSTVSNMEKESKPSVYSDHYNNYIRS